MTAVSSRLAACAVAVAAALLLPGCPGSAGDSGSGAEAAAPTSGMSATRLDGPMAALDEELTGGKGVFMGSLSEQDLAGAGYVESELVAAGQAVRYDPGPTWSGDGRWEFSEADEPPASYRTRALVRRPADADDFSGTVVLEWLNVSGGLDADPEWSNLHEEIVRSGHAWVGLSAQLIGVEGGPVLVSIPGAEDLVGKGLVNTDPQRYGSLDHPGDGYSFDIFTQVARALRVGEGLGDLEPDLVLAAGESQSAMALVTYHNGVQPLTGSFDGFFVHSRGSMPLPVVGADEYADLVGAFGRTPAKLREDIDVPVIVIQAEGDVTGLLNSSAARQPDDERMRLWEVTGTAHADRRLLGAVTSLLDCGVPINDGPMHIAAKAALHHLERWARGGDEPPTAPRLQLVDDAPTPTLERDAEGLAVGGLRLAPLEAPVEVLSGQPGPSEQIMCQLLGSTTAMTASDLAQRYPAVADYTHAYAAELERNIDHGYLLEDDREAMGEYERTDRLVR